MKIKTSKENWLKGLQIVQNVIPSKNTLQILSNILIEAKNNTITLTATDLDIGITSVINAEIIEDGAITIPAKKFFDITKELPDSEVIFTIKKNNVATIESEKCLFKIMGLSSEEFPKLPKFTNAEAITLEQSLFKNMLTKTSFAVSYDETRYILNGILFVLKENNLRLVATDGRRLALIEKEIENDKKINKNIILPTKTVNELSRILKDNGNVKILFSKNQISFVVENAVVISRLIEGEFPNYEQVIPPEIREKIIMDKNDLLMSVRRANLLTTQDSKVVTLDIKKDRMEISKTTPNLGEVKEELDIEYKGKDITIGFNPIYLIEGLKNISTEKISFEVTNADKPGVLRTEDNYLYIILPMQIA